MPDIVLNHTLILISFLAIRWLVCARNMGCGLPEIYIPWSTTSGWNACRSWSPGWAPARFIEGLASEIEADYRRWREFDKSPRHATHSPVGVIELMPISDGRLYSFKYVNGHPKNTAQGLLTVTAFGVLADVDTGYPVLLSELTFTTALRTAAMSALAARCMARPAQPHRWR